MIESGCEIVILFFKASPCLYDHTKDIDDVFPFILWIISSIIIPLLQFSLTMPLN
jgi:hypothetical protein